MNRTLIPSESQRLGQIQPPSLRAVSSTKATCAETESGPQALARNRSTGLSIRFLGIQTSERMSNKSRKYRANVRFKTIK